MTWPLFRSARLPTSGWPHHTDRAGSVDCLSGLSLPSAMSAPTTAASPSDSSSRSNKRGAAGGGAAAPAATILTGDAAGVLSLDPSALRPSYARRGPAPPLDADDARVEFPAPPLTPDAHRSTPYVRGEHRPSSVETLAAADSQQQPDSPPQHVAGQ